MKPTYDLNNLIKKHQREFKSRFPVDYAHIQESVFVSMEKKHPGIICDSTHIEDHVSVSLQNKSVSK